MHLSVATLRNKRFTSFYERLLSVTWHYTAVSCHLADYKRNARIFGTWRIAISRDESCFKAFQWNTGKLQPLTYKTVQKMPPRDSISHRPTTAPVFINRIANTRLEFWLITDSYFSKILKYLYLQFTEKLCHVAFMKRNFCFTLCYLRTQN